MDRTITHTYRIQLSYIHDTLLCQCHSLGLFRLASCCQHRLQRCPLRRVRSPRLSSTLTRGRRSASSHVGAGLWGRRQRRHTRSSRQGTSRNPPTHPSVGQLVGWVSKRGPPHPALFLGKGMKGQKITYQHSSHPSGAATRRGRVGRTSDGASFRHGARRRQQRAPEQPPPPQTGSHGAGAPPASARRWGGVRAPDASRRAALQALILVATPKAEQASQVAQVAQTKERIM